MAVAVGMGLVVGETVGVRVGDALGTSVALVVGETSGAAPPAQPTRQIRINSEQPNSRMVSFKYYLYHHFCGERS